MATNSYVKPPSATVPPATPSPTTITYRTANPFADVQPLVSDLWTANPTDNSMLNPTYTGDTAKIQERLGQYSKYDPATLGTLADYLRPQAALSNESGMYFKPADYDRITGNLSGISNDQLKQYQPLLGNLEAVGQAGNTSFYENPALTAQLGQYSTADLSGASSIKELASLAPITTAGGKNYYDKTAMSAAIDAVKANKGYGAVSDAMRTKYGADSFKNLQALGTIGDTSIYDSAKLSPLMGSLAYGDMAKGYGLNDYSKVLAPDSQEYRVRQATLAADKAAQARAAYMSQISGPSTGGYRNAFNMATGGDQRGLKGRALAWAMRDYDDSIRRGPGDWLTGDFGERHFVPAEPAPTTLAFNQQQPGDADWNNWNISQLLQGKDITWDQFSKGAHDLRGVTSNNDASEILRKQWDPLYEAKPIRALSQSLGTSLGLSTDEVNKVAGLVAAQNYQNNAARNSSPFTIGESKGAGDAMGADAYTDAILKYAENKYGTTLPEELRGRVNTSTDKLDKALRKLHKAPRSSSGGFFHAIFSGLDPILDKIDPLHNKTQDWVTKLGGFDSQEQAFSAITPAVVDVFAPGVGSALGAFNSATTGNLGAAAIGALGAGMSFGGYTPSYTGNVGVDRAITNAGMSGLGAAASGGNMSDILKGAALGGLNSYGNSMLGNSLKGATPLMQAGAGAGYNALIGGVKSALSGGSFGKGAMTSGLGSAAGALGNYATNSLMPDGINNSTTRGITNAFIKSLIQKQLRG